MVANLSLNQFAPNQPIDGLYVYMANEGQLHNVIVSASQSDALTAGNVVVLDAASTNVHAPVVLAADVDEKPFGIVTFTPVKATHAAGERVALAREHDVIWKTANSAIAVGDVLAFDSDFKVEKASAGSGETLGTIGIALTPASSDGDLIQVELHFGTVVGE